MATAIQSPVRSFYKAEPKAQRGAQKETRNEAALLSEEKVEEYFARMSKAHKTKVRQLVNLETLRMGYSQVRSEGTIWMKARRKVISDLVRMEVDLDEIELEEPAITVEETGFG